MSDSKKEKIKSLLAKRSAGGLATISSSKKKKKVQIENVSEEENKSSEPPIPEQYQDMTDSSDIDEDAGFEWEKVKDWKNKQRTMIVGSRGIGFREKHLMMDLMSLLPHSKKEAKIDKSNIQERIREVCRLNSCQN